MITIDGNRLELLLQEFAPQVLAVVARRLGRFDLAEDATQEALIAAAQQWPVDGVPDNPRGWLVAVATRRLIDALRAEAARARREEAAFVQEPPPGVGVPDQDDTLTVLFLCCHPALSPPSQLALTLRAVGGLTTAQIATAFLVPEPTMAQRISRAKATIADAGAHFELPPDDERAARLGVVLHVLYLIFNEGYAATSGERLQRSELAREAIRLTRMTHALVPGDGEVAGLLALMLLTQARSGARDRSDGRLIPLAEQDRLRWDAALVKEGTELIEQTLSRAPLGPYQLQAAIAAVHTEAATAADTDWPQVLKLYDLLRALAPSPVVTLNRAVAVAMVEGPRAGLADLDALDSDRRLSSHHRLASVRAHLHEMANDTQAALAGYEDAARRTTSIPERRYLQAQAERLRGDVENPPTAPTIGWTSHSPRSTPMRYMLLIYQNTEAWNGLAQADKDVLMHAAGDIVEELSATGEWVGGEGLMDASQARSTRVRDGVVTVTDGPFLEAKEALAGYCIVDVATPERSEEIAVRWPDAQHWGLEIRALMQGGGEEI